MIPAPFQYHAPATVADAVSLLRTYGPDARPLGGGQSLVPLMRLRLAQPGHVIDLGRVRGMDGVRREKDAFVVGAMRTYRDILATPQLTRWLPILGEACSVIGDLQVRNRGTIGGSLAHADPAADLAAVFLALEGSVRVAGGRRPRSIPAARFFLDPYTTALAETELITEVVLPLPPKGTGMAYEKVANKASRFAIVGVAALVTPDRRGRCVRARVGVTGVAPVPFRAKAVERFLTGKPITAKDLTQAASRASVGVEPLEDQHASGEYRLALLEEVTRIALTKAAERAGVSL